MRATDRRTHDITGELTFEGAPVDLTGAAVLVRVDDVSRADAASSPIAEFRIEALPEGTTTATPIAFALTAELPDDRAQYALWARVDLDRDGQTSVGDFLTMETVSVMTRAQAFIRLPLRRVD